MSSIITYIKDILAPKKCYWCQKQWHFLCPQCESKILKHNSVCYVCKKKTDRFTTHTACQKHLQLDQVILYAHYRDMHISQLIKQGKFYCKKDIWEELAHYYVTMLQQNLSKNFDEYILIPVPMYRWKKYLRGYNQSELLVKHISKQLWIMAEYNLIKKTKKTKQQSHLNKDEREENLAGSFRINTHVLDRQKQKTFILIDDVVSTGTTLNTLSWVLYEHGAQKIIACALASD